MIRINKLDIYKTMKAKSSAYPAVMIASLFGLVVLVLGAMQFSVSIEQPQATVLPVPPVPSATPTGKKQGATIAKMAGVPGALILSNQSDLPV